MYFYTTAAFFALFLTVWLCPLAAVNMDYTMEGTNVALAVFIPTAVILVVVLGIYIYFAKWVLPTRNLEHTRCWLKRPNVVVGPSSPPQAAGKDHQDGDVLAAVRQHDRGVGFWQPGVRERSEYGRREQRERRGLTEHQRAVLIHHPLNPPTCSSSCPVISQSASRGRPQTSSVTVCAHENRRVRKGNNVAPSCLLSLSALTSLPSRAWSPSASCPPLPMSSYCVRVCGGSQSSLQQLG